MNVQLILPMREYFSLRYLNHSIDTTTYMEAITDDHADEYYKDIDDEIHSLMIRDTREVIPRNSVSYDNVLPGIYSSKYKKKHECTIKKSKARYCIIGCILKRLLPKYLNLYCPVVQWYTVNLILQFILGLRIKLLTSKMPFIRHIFQVVIHSTLNFPGVSILMEGNVMLLPD